jgi:hypothetical protein
MSTMIRSWSRCSAVLLLACAALCLGAAASGATTAVTRFQHESYQAFQSQLSAGRIHAASFNKKAHTLHLSLTDGRHMLVSYPSHEESRLASRLRAHGASVLVKRRPKAKAVHHTLRYVAGGLLVLVIAVVAFVLLGDRPRRPPSGAEPAVGSRPPAGPEPAGPEAADPEAAIGSQPAIEPAAAPSE